jgi:cytochrome o ubiquinol oxidase subunit 3
MAHSGNGAVAAQEQSHDHAHDGHLDLEALRMMGFWIFLITDCILFGSLFATYIVLNGNTAGGPTPSEMFEMPGVIAETFILLTSS